ncbi:MAG: hypothetical protein AAF378_18880 [Cyanobacteria bacterium P01_A01_bin.84]
MLAIIVNEQILEPRRVCETCLLADSSGKPRWQSGKLCCGHTIRKIAEQQAQQYECFMGFKIVKIE